MPIVQQAVAQLPEREESVSSSGPEGPNSTKATTNNASRYKPNRIVEFVIEDLPEVRSDGSLMRIVIDDLLRNAHRYTSQDAGARIEFGCQKPVVRGGISAGFTYYVRDHRAGFDQERAGTLFQPFQRLHAKSDFPGTGIGLALFTAY